MDIEEPPKRTPRLKINTWRDSCARKIKFRSRKAAEAAGANLLKRGRGETRVYECKEHFHLTSNMDGKAYIRPLNN